jgi:hypothetical protein
MRKTIKKLRVSSVLENIRNKHLPNTNLENYPYTNLLLQIHSNANERDINKINKNGGTYL